MHSIDKNAPTEEQKQPTFVGRVHSLGRDVSMLAGSFYGNGYAQMYGPPLVKNALKVYLDTYGPTYLGSTFVTGMVNTGAAYTQAAAITPYLGAAGAATGGMGAALGYLIISKIFSVAGTCMYNAVVSGKKEENIVARREEAPSIETIDFFPGSEEVNA